MKTFTAPYTAQGDLNIFNVNKIPEGVNELNPESDGKHILAHSETGHHHVVDGANVRVLKQDEFISFIDVKEESNIIHLRSFHTHETIKLPPGQYRISKQREYTPKGYRRAAD